MKRFIKTVTLLSMVAIMMLMLCACEKRFKTFGDIMDASDHYYWTAANNEMEVRFDCDGIAYKATFHVPDDMMEQWENIEEPDDVDDWDEFSRKHDRIFASLPIITLTNLTKDYPLPSQEKLNRYIGQPAQLLLDDGFKCGLLDAYENTCVFKKGVWRLTVTFKDDIDTKNDTTYAVGTDNYIASLIVDKIEAAYY